MAKKIIKFELDGFAEDAFEIQTFSGTEGLSTLWSYALTVISKAQTHDFDKMLEAKAHLHFGDPELHIHGMLCSVQQGFDGTWKPDSGQRTRLDLLFVPELWKLTLNVVTRYFRDMTVEDIIKKVLQKHSLTPEFSISGAHPKHHSVLQYQESDLDFVQRLCEHEGIHYHFIHDDAKEIVKFGDVNSAFVNIKDPSDLPLRLPKPASGALAGWGPWAEEKTIRRLQNRQRFVPKSVMLMDYHYPTPGHSLKVQGDNPGSAALGTQFFFGEHYKNTKEGETLRDLRKEEILTRKNAFTGASNDYMIYAGGVFKVVEADVVAPGLAGEYIVTEFLSEGSQSGDWTSGKDTGNDYRCTFTCIPKAVVYRPALRTRWPIMDGLYSGTVISASEEYSDVEGEGRYHVQFHFDVEKSGSVAVRRLQSYVGDNYGFHAPLHKGVEVQVAFENGDPDRPIIVAAAHNPAFKDTVIADNHTQSVWRSGGNNEFMMDDTKGSEKFYQHCEKDLEIKTENDKTESTGNDETLTVGHDRTREVKNDEKVTIKANRTKDVTSNETITIGGNQKITIDGNRSEAVKSNKDTTVTGNFNEKIDGDEERKIGGNVTETVTGNVTTDISGNTDLTVGGDKTEEIGGNSEDEAGGNITFEAGGNIESEAGGDVTSEAGGDVGIEAGGDIGVEAGLGIEMEAAIGFEIKAGADFEVEAGGKVKIEAGGEMNLKGTSGVTVEGAKYEVKADGEVSVKGSVVKLN